MHPDPSDVRAGFDILSFWTRTTRPTVGAIFRTARPPYLVAGQIDAFESPRTLLDVAPRPIVTDGTGSNLPPPVRRPLLL